MEQEKYLENHDNVLDNLTDRPSDGGLGVDNTNQEVRSDDSLVNLKKRAWHVRFEDLSGELKFVSEKGEQTVQVKACFPWTAGQNFLSLVAENGEVCVTIENPLDLPDQELLGLMKSLKQTGFLFEIVQVLELVEEFELRNWKVQTAQGPRRFQTSMESWPRRLPDGSFLLEDVTGDVYRVSTDVPCAKKYRSVFLALLD